MHFEDLWFRRDSVKRGKFQ